MKGKVEFMRSLLKHMFLRYDFVPDEQAVILTYTVGASPWKTHAGTISLCLLCPKAACVGFMVVLALHSFHVTF